MIRTRFLCHCLVFVGLLAFSLSAHRGSSPANLASGCRTRQHHARQAALDGRLRLPHARGKREVQRPVGPRMCAGGCRRRARGARVIRSAGHASRAVAGHLPILGAALWTAPKPGGIVLQPYAFRARGGKESRAAALPTARSTSSDSALTSTRRRCSSGYWIACSRRSTTCSRANLCGDRARRRLPSIGATIRRPKVPELRAANQLQGPCDHDVPVLAARKPGRQLEIGCDGIRLPRHGAG